MVSNYIRFVAMGCRLRDAATSLLCLWNLLLIENIFTTTFQNIFCVAGVGLNFAALWYNPKAPITLGIFKFLVSTFVHAPKRMLLFLIRKVL